MIPNYATGVNELPEALAKEILADALKIADRESFTPYVAFDADGTLWLNDASEVFFNYQIDHDLVDLPKEPWAHYRALKAKNPRNAFSWLAQVLEGQTVSDVKVWAKKSFESQPLLPFKSIFSLIKELAERGIEIWIVTASVQWPVEAAAEHYGLPIKGVLGVTTQVRDQKITPEKVLPVTWREGKAQALKAQKPDNRPLFCAGNTPGDTFLMELSQTKPLALHSRQQPQLLRDSEKRLQELAKEREWRRHIF